MGHALQSRTPWQWIQYITGTKPRTSKWVDAYTIHSKARCLYKSRNWGRQGHQAVTDYAGRPLLIDTLKGSFKYVCMLNYLNDFFVIGRKNAWREHISGIACRETSILGCFGCSSRGWVLSSRLSRIGSLQKNKIHAREVNDLCQHVLIRWEILFVSWNQYYIL